MCGSCPTSPPSGAHTRQEQDGTRQMLRSSGDGTRRTGLKRFKVQKDHPDYVFTTRHRTIYDPRPKLSVNSYLHARCHHRRLVSLYQCIRLPGEQARVGSPAHVRRACGLLRLTPPAPSLSILADVPDRRAKGSRSFILAIHVMPAVVMSTSSVRRYTSPGHVWALER